MSIDVLNELVLRAILFDASLSPFVSAVLPLPLSCLSSPARRICQTCVTPANYFIKRSLPQFFAG